MDARLRNALLPSLLIIALLWVLAACAAPPIAPTAEPPTSSAPPATSSGQAPAPTTAVTAAAPTQPPAPAGIAITDSAGRKVTLAAPPKRIVSLAPSTTEIVCAVGGCDALIGIDQFSDFPAEVKSKPVLSDGFNPNYEQIVAANPDLVLAAGVTSPDAVKKLEDLKLNVLVVGAISTTFDSIQSEIAMVGKALGKDAEAAQVIAAMDAKLVNVAAKIAQAQTKPRVFWELDATDPAKPYTPGPGSFVDELITRAGGQNIASGANSPYPQLSAEEIIRANPEVIILSDAAYGIAPESVGQRPGWAVILAVKNNKVFPIDDNLVSRPGPRVADGLEAAAKLIHPELFTQ